MTGRTPGAALRRARPSIGVDFGGVITSRANDGSDTSFFSDNFLRTTAVPGAIEGLGALMLGGFGEGVHIVTKCGPAVEEKTRLWLDHHDVYSHASIAPDRVHVTRTREGKAPIARRLGLTHFVDDRLDVLGYLSAVQHRYLFDDGRRLRAVPAGVVVVGSWPELVQLCLASLRAGPSR